MTVSIIVRDNCKSVCKTYATGKPFFGVLLARDDGPKRMTPEQFMCWINSAARVPLLHGGGRRFESFIQYQFCTVSQRLGRIMLEFPVRVRGVYTVGVGETGIIPVPVLFRASAKRFYSVLAEWRSVGLLILTAWVRFLQTEPISSNSSKVERLVEAQRDGGASPSCSTNQPYDECSKRAAQRLVRFRLYVAGYHNWRMS